MDTSEIYPLRIKTIDVLISKKGEAFMFPVADGTAKLSGKDYEFRAPTLRREQTVRSEDLSGGLQGEPGEPQPTESKDDAEARADFSSIQGDFICRHHNEPRVQLHVPKEETRRRRTQGIPKTCEEKIGKAYVRGHAVQKRGSFWHQETGSGAECISQGSKDNIWLYSGIHKAMSGTFST